MDRFEIVEVNTPEDIAGLRQLLEIYGEVRKHDAALGDYEQELAELPGIYARPAGCALLAYVGAEVAGCVAYRPLETGVCEMKRLFVSDAFKGRGIGKALVERLIEEARNAGYRKMRLDTHRWMETARQLYSRFGFKEIDAYNQNPTPGIRFFEREL